MARTFRCPKCGVAVLLAAGDERSRCGGCGSSFLVQLKRDIEPQEHGPKTPSPASSSAAPVAPWDLAPLEESGDEPPAEESWLESPLDEDAEAQPALRLNNKKSKKKKKPEKDLSTAKAQSSRPPWKDPVGDLLNHRWVWIGGGGLALLLLVMGMAFLGRGKGRGTPARDEGSGRVVWDQPAGEVVHEQPWLKPALPPAAAREIAVDAPVVAKQAWLLTDFTSEPAPPPQIAPSESPLVNTNLNFFAPTFAGMNGPFVLTAQIRQASRIEPPADAPPATVIDLRDGAVVQKYSPRIVSLPTSRLSPDGQWFLCIDYSMFHQVPETPLHLQVWQPGQPKSSFQIPVTDVSTWYDFVSPTEVAFVQAVPRPQLAIWDLPTGKIAQTIDLPSAFEAVNRFHLESEMQYGAVSPNGRLLAIAAPKEIHVIDRQAGQVLGSLPTWHVALPEVPSTVEYNESASSDQYIGIGFNAEGSQLRAILRSNTPYPRSHWDVSYVVNWNLANGEMSSLRACQSPHLPTGRLYEGPLPGTIIMSGKTKISGSTFTDRNYGHLIDIATGEVLYSWEQEVQRCDPEGHAVLVGVPSSGPRLDLTKPILQNRAEKDKTNTRGPQDVQLYVSSLDWPAYVPYWKQELAKFPTRTPPVQVDRTAVRVLMPTPPAQPVEIRASPAREFPTQTYHTPPVGQCDTRVAVLNWGVKVDEPYLQTSVWKPQWEQYDRQTGKLLATVPLQHYLTEDRMSDDSWRTPPPVLCALSRDGNMLAIRDYDAPANVDIWTQSGERTTTFSPSEFMAAIDWLAWLPSGELLTVAGGRMILWDVAGSAPRATLEIPGAYCGEGAIESDGAWVALGRRDGTIDIIDVTNGQCLARCDTASVMDPILKVALAPSGTQILAVTASADKSPGAQPTIPRGYENDRPEKPHVWLAWDWKNRTIQTSPIQWGVTDISWMNEKFGYAQGQFLEVARGRQLRLRHEHVLGPNSIFIEGQQVLSPDDITVQVDVDLGNKAWSEAAAKSLAGQLMKLGYRIGPGGWTYEVRYVVGQVDEEIHIGGSIKYLPVVSVKHRLLTDKGAPATNGQSDLHFLNTGSRFYRKTTERELKPPGQQDLVEVTDYYDFPRNMRESVISESLEVHSRSIQLKEQEVQFPTHFAVHEGQVRIIARRAKE